MFEVSVLPLVNARPAPALPVQGPGGAAGAAAADGCALAGGSAGACALALFAVSTKANNDATINRTTEEAVTTTSDRGSPGRAANPSKLGRMPARRRPLILLVAPGRSWLPGV